MCARPATVCGSCSAELSAVFAALADRRRLDDDRGLGSGSEDELRVALVAA